LKVKLEATTGSWIMRPNEKKGEQKTVRAGGGTVDETKFLSVWQ